MNRFIAEKVMGLEGWYCPVCQRELVPKEVTYEEECTICGCHIVDPDYTTPADYFALLQFAIRSEWWQDFLKFTFDAEYGDTNSDGVDLYYNSDFIKYILAPENFPRLVAE